MSSKKTFNELFKEHYYIGLLPEAKRKKWELIQRYYNQVSPRLKNESTELYELGKKTYGDAMRQIMSKADRFFLKVAIDEAWLGPMYVPIELRRV